MTRTGTSARKGKAPALQTALGPSSFAPEVSRVSLSGLDLPIGPMFGSRSVSEKLLSFVHTLETSRRKPPPTCERPKSRNPILQAALDQCPTYGRRNYHRRFAIRVARLANKAGLGKLSSRIGYCSQTLGYDESGTLCSREACRAQECSTCQAARSAQWAARVHEAMPAIVAEHPTWRFIMLTVTVPSVPLFRLHATVAHLHKCVEKMARRKAFAPVGWIRNTEETIENGWAHPHAHLLCAVPPEYFEHPLRKVKGPNGRPRIEPGYMTHRQWQMLWGDCLGLQLPEEYSVFDVPDAGMTLKEWRALWPNDDAPVIDVRAVSGDVRTPEARREIYEITKYGTKPSDLVRMDPADFRTLYHEHKGRRSISICGALAPYLKEMPDDEEPATFPNVVIAAHWNEEHKRYLTEFGVWLENEQEKRAALNAAQLPDYKLMARAALVKNAMTAKDYADADRLRAGTVTKDDLWRERMVNAEDERRFRLDESEERRHNHFWDAVLSDANARHLVQARAPARREPGAGCECARCQANAYGADRDDAGRVIASARRE